MPFSPPESLQKGSPRTQRQQTGSSRFCWWHCPPLAAHTQGAQHGYPPPVCLFTFILTRGIITIVCNISWKNESWAPCLPAAGDAATSSSSAAPRAASHSSHPPVQSRLLGRRGHRAALLPALTWAAGSRPSLIPHTHAQKALDGFQHKVLQRTPSPRRRRCSLSCDV